LKHGKPTRKRNSMKASLDLFSRHLRPEDIERAKAELRAAKQSRVAREGADTISIFLDGECVHSRRTFAAIKKAFRLSPWAVVVVAPKLEPERVSNIVSVRSIPEEQILARSVVCVNGNCFDQSLAAKALMLGVPQVILMPEKADESEAEAGSASEVAKESAEDSPTAVSTEYADKVIELGAGTALAFSKEVDAGRLRELVEAVLDDAAYLKAAAAASKQLLQSPNTSRAAKGKSRKKSA